MRVPLAQEPVIEVQVSRDSGGFCRVRWLPGGVWTGTCPGYENTGTCKHINKIRVKAGDYDELKPDSGLL